jgi:signal transduction histidine kinase
MDISNNFESLNFLVVVGDTKVEAFLEQFVGFLGGFVVVAVGLVRWIPSVQRLNSEISERKQTEEGLREARNELELRVEERTQDLARLSGDLRIARDEAELASRAKSEFLANMSHKLRTPLNVILGFSELMGNATLGPLGNPKYQEYTKDINDSGRHLLALIDDNLDLAKIEAGKLDLDEEDIDIARTIRSCMVLVKERAANGGVKLKTDIPQDLPALHADQRKLKQILVNLLSNAVKFTPSGGEVTLKAWWREDSGYVFQVIDTGIGIALEDIPTALSPFGQVDRQLDRKYEGTGLGLPLTKSLVEMHGGSLNLQSEVGVGTTVTVRFPAKRIVTRWKIRNRWAWRTEQQASPNY